jgi:dTMP kinase
MAIGKFITFEGGEGCGKSTQVRRLKSELEKLGIRVLLTREPGGTALAEKIRTLLKDESEDPPCDRAELLLFLAARAQLTEKVIAPALASGVWVISDRFSDSTVAYQGYGRGLPLPLIRTANDFACGEIRPDMTVLLDVDPATAEARMRRREEDTATSADRIELAGDDFHRRLREGFDEIARSEPDRVKRVDAGGTPEEVQERIWKLLTPFL